MPGIRADAAALAPLTPIEIALLADIAGGRTRKEVSELRGVSISTIRVAIRSAERKLGARTTEQAVAIAVRTRVL